ncbi:hypothetical protein GCM10025734_55700 [Kitasatospora paranensis]
MSTPTQAPITFELKPSAHPLSDAEREARLTNPGFGRIFTDHMVTIRWTEGMGWHDAQLTPYAPLEIDPANMTLHYGQSIFEGLKAYRQADGSIATFRPEANAVRFQNSARRLAMPELPVETFVEAVELLVQQEQGWVPNQPEQSLYLRPFMFATEVGLGVRPANSYLFMIIASPAGAYFSGGIKPVSVWLSEEYVRAAPGGTGAAKCAGNYAASLVAQAQAAAKGCDQVVWLDAAEHRWIEEMGGMNLYFVFGEGADAKIVTPSCPARSSRASPATRCSSSPPTSATPSRSGRSPPTSGSRATPTAPSPRSSPAAPPRSSPRSARSSPPAATGRSARASRAR